MKNFERYPVAWIPYTLDSCLPDESRMATVPKSNCNQFDSGKPLPGLYRSRLVKSNTEKGGVKMARDCRRCGGDGYVVCPACDGTGTIDE